ncbi:MAG: DUF3499 family protein [Arcanobacterium sp.]|nr:DUF3499 family protein [Arcanobacterium sp.]
MSEIRTCSRAACPNPAVATITFDYRGAVAVLGPLAPEPQPGALDLCEQHMEAVTVPVGWELVRLQAELEVAAQADPEPAAGDQLTALADALSAAETVAREKRSHAHPTGDLPNPWISQVQLPSVRPHLTVIDGGEDSERQGQ